MLNSTERDDSHPKKDNYSKWSIVGRNITMAEKKLRSNRNTPSGQTPIATPILISHFVVLIPISAPGGVHGNNNSIYREA